MNILEIDQKQIKIVRQAFLDLSRKRFQRMETSLSPTQSDYLKLLPLLFHVNHPMLPGYVDKFTPCGLPNYNPTLVEKRIAKTVSQSFEYKPRAHLTYRIASLFLMGSMGTLGQSSRSDIDLWICLADHLDKKLLLKLEKKGNKIKNWLAFVGIELNFYLVSLDDFSAKRRKKIGVDACGNTQNYLLLDEFYRTAVWFAGRWPLWWVIPPQQDYSQYALRLLKDKHIDSADWIDFGEVKQIPSAEYFSAALWQLYKAIESPYKSSVKLLVLEVYAKLFPCSGILSDQFKRRVYSLDNDQELDPYLHILNFAEKALINNPRRLEFLRRAFYLKANVKITPVNKRTAQNSKMSWRNKMMRKLIARWGWNPARLNYLNTRHQWSVIQVAEERKDLVRELTSSYHFLSSFARIQGVINQVAKMELLSLGRKLYAAFERRSGKLEKLNNGIAKNIHESAITLSCDGKNQWALYLGHIEQKKIAISQSAFVGSSFFECLCWACTNEVIDSSSGLHVHQIDNYLTHRMASETSRDIMNLVQNFDHSYEISQFDKKAKIIDLGVFINTRHDPLVEDKQENIYRVATHSDCFSWTDKKLNLVSHFDVVSINSWGEITVQHFHGDTAWIEFFQQFYSAPEQKIKIANVYCRGLVQKDDIKQRVIKLLAEWNRLLANSRRTQVCNRYIMMVGNKWLVTDLLDQNISYSTVNSVAKLYQKLGENPFQNRAETKVKIHLGDSLTLSPFVSAIIKRRLTDSLDFFVFQKNEKVVEIIVKSINGTIFYQSHRNTSISQLVGHYQLFFEKIQNRNLLSNGLLEKTNYYRCTNSLKSSSIHIKRLTSTLDQEYQQFSLVQAIATQKHVFSAGFDLFTDDQSFFYNKHGEGVYQRLRAVLLKKRKDRNSYPIFLTDLDLSAISSKVSILDSLQYKRSIEAKLNRNR